LQQIFREQGARHVPATTKTPRLNKGLRGFLRRLAMGGRDESGAAAVFFAVSLILLAPLTLGMMDVYVASSQRGQLQDALDAATLFAARSSAGTTAAIDAVGDKALASNLVLPADVTLVSSNFTLNGETVTGYAEITPSAIAPGLWPHSTIQANATVVRALNNVEVALVLDNTGSMTGQKMIDLKSAASTLVDTLAVAAARPGGDPNPVKISLIPYTMTVNVGPTYQSAAWLTGVQPTSAYGSDIFATANTNRFTLFTQMGKTWGGCVEARPSPYDVTESPPTVSTPGSMYVAYFAPDEPGGSGSNTFNSQTFYNNYLADGTSSTTWNNSTGYVAQAVVAKYNTHTFIHTGTNGIGYQYGPNAGCEIQPLTRLTTNFSALKIAINAMTAGGDTDIKAGVMWGWHTLSPNAPFSDGVAYGTARHDKIMVLMTDGQNHNVAVPNSNGSVYSGDGYMWQNRIGMSTTSTLPQRITKLDQRLALACTNAKAAGIIVYTVVLVDTTVDQSTVRGCASSADKTFDVTSSSGLTAAFAAIAGSIDNLRISK
jgi:Flp pilus assembly protein TadG